MPNYSCDAECALSDGWHECVLPKHHKGKHQFSQKAKLESKWLVSSCHRFVIKQEMSG